MKALMLQRIDAILLSSFHQPLLAVYFPLNFRLLLCLLKYENQQIFHLSLSIILTGYTQLLKLIIQSSFFQYWNSIVKMSERGLLSVEIYEHYCLRCEIGIGLEFPPKMNRSMEKELTVGPRAEVERLLKSPANLCLRLIHSFNI